MWRTGSLLPSVPLQTGIARGFLGYPATVGQVVGTPLLDPQLPTTPNEHLVGRCPVVAIQVNGRTVQCLLDTGSQVTLFAESLTRELFGAQDRSMAEAPWLTLRGANGLDIPYVGYLVTDLEIHGVVVPQKGVVVVRDDCLGSYRALLGMNVISECWEELFQGRPARAAVTSDGQEWDRVRADCRRVCLAEQQGERESIGRLACRYALSIPARSEAMVWARVPPRLYSPEEGVLVEPYLDGPKVEVARGLATVRRGRVSIKVRNLNSFPIHLHRHQRLARITSVKPQQIQEQGEVEFSQVSPTVVEVALAQTGRHVGEAGEGLPTHLEGESLRGEGLEEDQAKQLQSFLSKWQHLFSTHDEDYGRTDAVKHQIPTGEAAPSRERYRPVPPTLYSEVRTLLKGMLDKGIIRESSSPWAAPIVLVRKKNGSWRFCVDYRRLNQVTKRDAFPLPRVEDSLTSLTQAAWYSTLDLASGYWQVQVDERDREKTAFTTPFGLYEWDRMPFGLCNAPATFQRLMQRCLGGQLMETTLVYLDDVIVYSPDFGSHLQHLEQVFRSLERYGLKLQPDKCQLFRKEVKFLGHIVSAAGISVDPEKVAAVQGWTAPKTVRQVRSFLGFVGYYRRFIQDFSKIAKPINQLLGGAGRVRGRGSPLIQWGPTCEAAFQKLKQELLQAPILAYADFTQPFILYTDASNLGLGAVLAQRQKGEERVIAYASRSLHPTEKNDANYSSFKLELLAMKWALSEKFKDYLWGAKVQVVTDNNPLVHLQTAKLGAVEQRWVAQLANFDYQLRYRPGREHTNADVLSRLPEEGSAGPVVTLEVGHDEGLMVGIVEVPGQPSEEPPGCWGWDPQRWRSWQGEDEDLLSVRTWLSRKTWPEGEECRAQTRTVRGLLGQRRRLYLREGVICRALQDPRLGDKVCQVVVPEGRWPALLEAYHTRMGHQGQERTTALLRRYFYWPGMEGTTRAYLQRCPRCILFKTRKEVRAPLVPIQAKAPLHIVAMDYLTLGRPVDRIQYILVVMDLFTKYAWAVPTLDQTAITTADALWKYVVQPFGCPEVLHSDQGPNFESRVIHEMCRLYGGKKTHTTPYHPQGNGGCERFNQTLLSLLGTLEEEQQGHWADRLPALVQAYNNSVHSTTGYAPTYLMFGRHVRLPIDLLLGTAAAEEGSSLTEWVTRHHQRLQSAYEQVSGRINQAAVKNKRLYDRTAREAPLLPGERVLVRDNRRRGKGKLSDRWESQPYVVQRQPHPDQPVYALRPEGRAGPERVLHRNLVRPCPNYPTPVADKPPVEATWMPQLVGWAVVPRGLGIEPRPEEPPSPARRSQRENRGRPPARYGDWVSGSRSRD
ncbi:reverse transcriptase domain-containing protein [Cetobacterium sp.]|uniref:reverse transcriptase domain-containing protein n=1 Tax=Cetobacterium sp. TaxID=2071632 RepID=UPI003F3F5931